MFFESLNLHNALDFTVEISFDAENTSYLEWILFQIRISAHFGSLENEKSENRYQNSDLRYTKHLLKLKKDSKMGFSMDLDEFNQKSGKNSL